MEISVLLTEDPEIDISYGADRSSIYAGGGQVVPA